MVCERPLAHARAQLVELGVIVEQRAENATA